MQNEALSNKERMNSIHFGKMDGTGACFVKWNKPDIEGHELHWKVDLKAEERKVMVSRVWSD